jgi:hypothetical protein
MYFEIAKLALFNLRHLACIHYFVEIQGESRASNADACQVTTLMIAQIALRTCGHNGNIKQTLIPINGQNMQVEMLLIHLALAMLHGYNTIAMHMQ